MIYRSGSGAIDLVERLWQTVVTFGICEDTISYGGPKFIAGKKNESWGVRHNIAFVTNPHVNCRAELGVTSVKRMFDRVS